MGLLTTMMDSVLTLRRPRPRRESTGSGTVQDPFIILVSNVPCSCQPAGPSVIERYAQQNTEVSCQIYLTEDIGAQVNDYVDVYDQNDKLHRFMVKGMPNRLFFRWSSPYVLDCSEIDPPPTRGINP
jgi:hypothetical protein